MAGGDRQTELGRLGSEGWQAARGRAHKRTALETPGLHTAESYEGSLEEGDGWRNSLWRPEDAWISRVRMAESTHNA